MDKKTHNKGLEIRRAGVDRFRTAREVFTELDKG
jgi:hypothetical protein